MLIMGFLMLDSRGLGLLLLNRGGVEDVVVGEGSADSSECEYLGFRYHERFCLHF